VQGVGCDDVDAGVRGNRGQYRGELGAGPSGVDRIALVGQRRQQRRDPCLCLGGQVGHRSAAAAQVVEQQQSGPGLPGKHADAGRAWREPDQRQRADRIDQFALGVHQHRPRLTQSGPGGAP